MLFYGHRIHIVIVCVGTAALILDVISLAGNGWIDAVIYQSGMFYGCGEQLAVYGIPLFGEVDWFHFVRYTLVLSVPVILFGIVFTFLRRIPKHKFISTFLFVVAADRVYYNFTAIVSNIMGKDFYRNVTSAVLALSCGIISLFSIIEPKIQFLKRIQPLIQKLPGRSRFIRSKKHKFLFT